MRGSEGERLRGGVLGLGLLMGGAVFSFGHSVGCTKAEILAIKDDGACSAFLMDQMSPFILQRWIEAAQFSNDAFHPCRGNGRNASLWATSM